MSKTVDERKLHYLESVERAKLRRTMLDMAVGFIPQSRQSWGSAYQDQVEQAIGILRDALSRIEQSAYADYMLAIMFGTPKHNQLEQEAQRVVFKKYFTNDDSFMRFWLGDRYNTREIDQEDIDAIKNILKSISGDIDA